MCLAQSVADTCCVFTAILGAIPLSLSFMVFPLGESLEHPGSWLPENHQVGVSLEDCVYPGGGEDSITALMRPSSLGFLLSKVSVYLLKRGMCISSDIWEIFHLSSWLLYNFTLYSSSCISLKEAVDTQIGVIMTVLFAHPSLTSSILTQFNWFFLLR